MKKKVVSLTSVVLLTSTFATTAMASSYTVQKGDTLSHIATKYNTQVSKLKTLNKLSSDQVYVNQVIKVAEVAKPVVTAPVPSTPIVHTVASGDSLSRIAQLYSISLSDLRKWNNNPSSLIFPGQTFVVSNPAATSTPKPVVAPAPVKVAAPVPVKANPVKTTAPAPVKANPVTPTPAAPSTASTYKVVAGDVLGRIAGQFGMTVAELRKLNGLTSDIIYVGQVLNVTKTLTTPVPTTSVVTAQALSVAKSMMGTPYVWGGSTATGVDCSGFIYYAFNQAGYKIGRYSAAGYYDRSYYVETPQVGDLVFFENTYKAGISHMGIYLGNNEFIHADSNNGVMISNLSNSYYQKHFSSFKRFY